MKTGRYIFSFHCGERRQERLGFTLLEVLVTVAIIGVLVSLLVPTLAAAKRKSGSVRCLSNLRQLGVLVRLEADENDGRLPHASGSDRREAGDPQQLPTLREVLRGASGASNDLFRCPADPDRLLGSGRISYEWNVSLNGRVLHRIKASEPGRTERAFLLRDREKWHPGGRRNAVFAGGEVGSLD